MKLLLLAFLFPYLSQSFAQEDIEIRPLQDCRQIVASQNKDVYGRNIVGILLEDLGGCQREVSRSRSPLSQLVADMENVQETVSRQEMLKDINDIALKNILKALLANEITLENPPIINLQNDQETFDFLSSNLAPGFSSPVFKSPEGSKAHIFQEALGEVRLAKDQGSLKTINAAEEALAFNQISDQINQSCSEIYSDFQKEFPQRWGIFSKGWDSEAEDAFRDSFRPTMAANLTKFFSQTKLGHLFGTEHFRRKVGNIGEDLVEKCSERRNFIAIKHINSQDISSAKSDMDNILLKMSRKNFQRRQVASIGFRLGVNSTLEEIIKEDPHLISQFLAENPDKAQNYSHAICKEILDIYQKDSRWRWADTVIGVGALALGAAGLATGAVLTATGFGAPAGLAIITGIVGVGAGSYDVASGLHKRDEGLSHLRASTVAVANRASNSESFLAEVRSSEALRDEGAFQTLVGAGGAVAEGAGAVRLLTRASRGERGAASSVNNLASPTPPPRTVRFSETSHEHVIFGEFSSTGHKEVLRGGMHTDLGLERLLRTNEDARAILTENGVIKSQFIREVNGGRQVLLPREAFQGRHFRDLKNSAQKFGTTFFGEVDGYEVVGKSLFPSRWDEEKILEAATAVVARGQSTFKEAANLTEYVGEVDGVRIMVVTDREGVIKTTYPLWD